MALGAYGYDWPQGRPASVVSAPQAEALARATQATIMRGSPDGDPHFAYADSGGVPHQVWWLDAAAYRTQRQAALARKVRGTAIWRLGLEDPALWTRPASSASHPPGPTAPFCTLLPH